MMSGGKLDREAFTKHLESLPDRESNSESIASLVWSLPETPTPAEAPAQEPVAAAPVQAATPVVEAAPVAPSEPSITIEPVVDSQPEAPEEAPES